MGRIMFVSSQAGQIGLFGYTAYSPSKFALRGLAESLQMEVSFCFCPLESPFYVDVTVMRNPSLSFYNHNHESKTIVFNGCCH